MEKFEVESVLHTKDGIHFAWRDLGGTYVVYRDGHLLYEGTVASFQDHQIKHARLYDYSIERVVNDLVVDVIRLQTSAYAEQKNVQNPLQSLVMTTIVSKHKIALSWEKVPGIEHYKVYKNERLLKEVQTNSYIDLDINISEPAIYRIQAKRLIVKSDERFNQSRALASAVFERMIAAKKEPATEKFQLTKEVSAPKELLRPIEDRKKIQVNEWKFRYMTFIKEKVVKNPNFFSRNHLFSGDDRDFHPNGSRYRTRVDISLDYEKVQSPMICNKHIGKTIAYNRRGGIRKVAVANYNGITLVRKDHKLGESGFLLTHDVQNPLARAPRLNYEVHAILRQDGVMDMTGFHNQAPHHEVYLMGDAKKWKPIHLVESNGLFWLSDLTSWNYWRYSNLI